MNHTTSKENDTFWFSKAQLPFSIVGVLCIFILSLNFSLDLLSVLNLQKGQKLLVAFLTIVMAAWALVETWILNSQNNPIKKHLNKVLAILVFQLLFQILRLFLLHNDQSINVTYVYGVSVVDIGSAFLLLPFYVLIFIIIFRALIISYFEAYKFLQDSNLKLELLSTVDPLTGAYNRRYFIEIFKNKTQKAVRRKEDIALAVLDIDFFKKVNDSFGHHVGDMVLTDLTKLIKKHLREHDVFARWGGEEFVILLPNCDAEHAFETAERLRMSIASHLFDEAGHQTCSFGVTQFFADDSLTTALARADAALYQAKSTGRNKVCVQ